MGSAAVPIAAAGLGGLGSYLSGARPESAKIEGYGGVQFPGLNPQRIFKGALGDLGRMGALATQYAATPVSMPSSYVQPLPMFKGAGPVDVFAGGIDPALPRPELQFRSGVDWGDSPLSIPFTQTGAGLEDVSQLNSDQDVIAGEVSRGGQEFMRGAVQQPAPAPAFGGAHSGLKEMQQALSLLRPGADAPGEFSEFLFTGASGPRGLAAAVPERLWGSKDSPMYDLEKMQRTIYGQAGYPTTGTGGVFPASPKKSGKNT